MSKPATLRFPPKAHNYHNFQEQLFVSVAPKLDKKSAIAIVPKPQVNDSVYCPPSPGGPSKYDSDRVLALSVTLTLVFLIIIGVPLAAALPQKYVVHLPVSIIIPLYMSPNPGACDRLFQSAMEHADINFTAIINPTSGPGAPPYPGELYIDGITKLNVYSNVRTVSHVDTKCGQRDNKTLADEVTTYATWSQKPGLALHGIFFNQTPAIGPNETRAYLTNITAPVKHSKNFIEANLTIYKPGSVPSRISIHLMWTSPLFSKAPMPTFQLTRT